MLKRAIFLLLAVFFMMLPARAEERINSFESRIEVLPDARIHVVEKILVLAQNDKINHGIFRDFPTIYKARNGVARKVPFKVLGVRRDGQPEPYRVTGIRNGERIYAGSPDAMVSQGPHVYEFEYEVENLIGYFDGYDEIYWNVTGNGWEFPIDRIKAEVVLPEGAKVLQSAGYTGPVGATGQDFFSQPTERGMMFYTRTSMPKGDGLTVAVGFPKGILPAPSPMSRFRLFDFIGLAGVLATFLVYYHVWNKVGRDPDMGVVVPEYDPPKGLSAASARYLLNMEWDDKIFAIGVVSLAVKGWLGIKLEKLLFSKQYSFVGQKSETPLTADEKKLAGYVAREGETFVVSQKHWKEVKGAQTGQKQVIGKQVDANYLQKNLKWNVPGVLMALASIVAIAFWGHITAIFGREMIGLFIPFAMLGFFAWIMIFNPLIDLVLGRRKLNFGTLLAGGVVGFFIYMFLFKADIPEMKIFLEGIDPLVVLELLSVFVLVAMMPVFARLMKAPTEAGQELRRHLLGYKLYLEMAEQQRLEFSHPPKMTPERFEAGLPWAMALDVENKWAARFEKECEVDDMSNSRRGYTPLWYTGVGAFAVSDMVSGLSRDLPSTLSSSAQDPSSHSGSGGGGSSGGGGGGGGGGGW